MSLYKTLLSYFDKRPNLSFLILLAIVSLFYNTYSIVLKTTYSAHQWRQADCLSITNSYYQDNAPFLEPHIQWIGKNNDNKTISEFPIIYYSVAQIWKITGKQEFIFRLIDLSIVLLGLFLTFRLILALIGDKFWAMYIPLLLYTSEILVYYSNNFLMNAPAFGLILIAWYFYWKYYNKKNNFYIVISMIIFLLAGLLKITSLISFIAILGISMAHLLRLPYFKDIKIHTNVSYYLSFLIVLIGIPIWYTYTHKYNSQHLPYIFLQDIFPIWELSPDAKKDIWNSLTETLLPRYFNKGVLLLLFLGLLLMLKDNKKASKFWISMSLSILIGNILYIILWYKAFDVHDYYLINLLIIIPMVSIGLITHLKKNYPKIYHSHIFKRLAIVLLVYLIYSTAISNRIKYKSNDYLVIHSPILTEGMAKKWDWYHYNYKSHFKALNELEPIFKELGIAETDTVVSLPDNSINISLYLMNRKGFSNFGYNSIPDSIKLEYFRKRGAKYLILNDTNISAGSWIHQLKNKKIRNYKNINIYDLR